MAWLQLFWGNYSYGYEMRNHFIPVFIGGTGRSGTTVIGNLLTRHPDFHTSMPREIKYLTERKGLIDFNFNRPLSDERSMKELRNALAGKLLPYLGKSNYRTFSDRINGRWWSETGKSGKPRGLVQGIEKSVLRAALLAFKEDYKDNPLFATRSFFFFLSEAQLKNPEIKFFSDTTPTNIINAQYLHQLFPESLFINMVRDGRDVASSVAKQHWGPNTALAALPWWEKRIQKAHKSLQQVPQSNQLTIRLEDLVTNKREETYLTILKFLGLTDHDKLHNYFDTEVAPEKMNSGRWEKEVANSDTFNSHYEDILKRLKRKSISI